MTRLYYPAQPRQRDFADVLAWMRPWFEQIAGYCQLDERAMRKAAGVTAEVVADAVAGRSLAPELVGRLVGFLEQQPAE